MRLLHNAQQHRTARFGLVFTLMAALLAGMASFSTARAQVAIGSVQPYTQDFNTLTTTTFGDADGSWQNNVTLEGWYASQGASLTTKIKTYDNTNPMPNPGLYSFGQATERALGVVGGAGGQRRMGVLVQNTSGVPITQMQVGYTGEQ